MKVLVLGTGNKDNIYESKCHPCLTKEEYVYCVKQAKNEGQLVTVDINHVWQTYDQTGAITRNIYTIN